MGVCEMEIVSDAMWAKHDAPHVSTDCDAGIQPPRSATRRELMLKKKFCKNRVKNIETSFSVSPHWKSEFEI